MDRVDGSGMSAPAEHNSLRDRSRDLLRSWAISQSRATLAVLVDPGE